MNRNYRLAGALVATMLLPGTYGVVSAEYHASSDTGIEALDYIENQHRVARENRLSAEQEKLLADAKALEKDLRYPLTEGQPMPIAFEGEELSYDERDGSFVAKGKVDILQMDAHRFQGELVTGNTKKTEVDIPDKAHILQMTPGQVRVTLDGYKAHYNYGTKEGSLEDAKGKAGAHYITGKRFEFYPDRIVVYNGTDTKCGAKKPDYHMSAEKMVIYPNQKIVMEKMGFYIKGKKIYSRAHYEAGIGENAAKDKNWPKIGYSNNDKMWFAWDWTFPLRKQVDLHTNFLVTGADGWRSNYDITWYNRGMSTGVTYGYFEDGNDNWIRKQPSAFWNYSRRLGHTHFTYNLNTEYGQWYGNGIHSNHGYYGLKLNYDPIKFHRYTLYLGTGYGVTHESYDDSRVDGMTFDAVLTKDFNERWAAYAGFHYNKLNRENSLFDFDTEDYTKKLEGGFSYRIDDANRIAIGTRYDVDHRKWKNIDYYWYHNFHCTQMILRYKSLSNTWNVRWEFTPW